MLGVNTIYACSAGTSAAYYTQYLTPDGTGERPGVWAGRGAAQLGLAGEVTTEDLEALLSGQDPHTGELLGSRFVDRVTKHGKLIHAVAGFDGTFSAPKSVSVLWALTGDDGWREAHDLAVQAVVDHVERYGATTRVRVNGPRSYPDAIGLTMAIFPQSTSREDDPQLHTHWITSSKVQLPDGRWYALDASYLKDNQRALGGIYQSVLRSELTARYEVAWEPIVKGQAEIAGIPDGVLEVFSKRTRQVEDLRDMLLGAFREREGRDPTKREYAVISREAATDSRRDKTGIPLDELMPRWQDEARELGWTGQQVLTAARQAVRTNPQQPLPTLDAVLDQVSVKASTWKRIDVLRAICDLTPVQAGFDGTRWARTLEVTTDQVIGEHLRLDTPPTGPVRASDGRSIWLDPNTSHLTHPTVLAQEERIITFALDAHDATPTASRTVDTGGLDVLQADAARAVAGHDRLVLVVGPVGTGKTTTLATARTDLALEVIIAPDATEEAIAIVGAKKNLRLLLAGGLPDPRAAGLTVKSVAGGLLVQSRDNAVVDEMQLQGRTKRAPTEAELADLRFAFRVAKHVKSNTIVYAKDRATVGIGAGQMSRVDCCAHRGAQGRGCGEGTEARSAAHQGLGGRLGCVLPVRRRTAGRDRGRRHRRDPAGRLDARRRGDQGGRRARHRDGVHRDAALPALSMSVRTVTGSCADPRQQQRAHAEEHHQHRHAGALAQRDRRHDADQQRPEERRHLAGEREQPEELRHLIGRREPHQQRARRRLHRPGDEADQQADADEDLLRRRGKQPAAGDRRRDRDHEQDRGRAPVDRIAIAREDQHREAAEDHRLRPEPVVEPAAEPARRASP